MKLINKNIQEVIVEHVVCMKKRSDGGVHAVGGARAVRDALRALHRVLHLLAQAHVRRVARVQPRQLVCKAVYYCLSVDTNIIKEKRVFA